MLTTIAASLLALIAPQDALSDCAGIADPAARLACYDRPSDETVPVPNTSTSYRRGQWLVASSVDPDTGTPTVGLAVVADQSSTRENPPTLLFRCVGGTLDTLIDWDTSIRRDGDETVVTTQIDAQRPEAIEWRVSADGTATYAPVGREYAFLSGLYFAQRLVARVTPEDEPVRTAGFNVSGLLDVAPALWDTCPPR